MNMNFIEDNELVGQGKLALCALAVVNENIRHGWLLWFLLEIVKVKCVLDAFII